MANTRSWVFVVRALLQYLGFNHDFVWMLQNVGDDNIFLED